MEVDTDMVGRQLLEGTVAAEEVSTNAATSWPLLLLLLGLDGVGVLET